MSLVALTSADRRAGQVRSGASPAPIAADLAWRRQSTGKISQALLETQDKPSVNRRLAARVAASRLGTGFLGLTDL
jgi:hypothetical protein